jgi:1-acyl-sn-glycerol-3-phosphate acyltransferase
VRALRLLALTVVLLAGMSVALIVPLLSAASRRQVVRRWFRAVVAASGVRLRVSQARSGPAVRARAAAARPYGQDRSSEQLWGPDGEAVLVAANHVSWLDIPALLAVAPARVLAKSDVRAWPVLGLLAYRGGTIFIDRRRLRRLPATVAEIAGALHDGQSVLVFPEGSTWCGRVHGRIYPATMQSAIDAGAPIRPVALRYRFADGTPTTVAAFVGDDTLVASVWRVVSARDLVVEVDVRPLVTTSTRTRRELAVDVSTELNVGQPPTLAGVAPRSG